LGISISIVVCMYICDAKFMWREYLYFTPRKLKALGPQILNPSTPSTRGNSYQTCSRILISLETPTQGISWVNGKRSHSTREVGTGSERTSLTTILLPNPTTTTLLSPTDTPPKPLHPSIQETRPTAQRSDYNLKPADTRTEHDPSVSLPLVIQIYSRILGWWNTPYEAVAV